MNRPWYEVVTEDPAEATVIHFGRGLYWVASRSRQRKEHICDLEGFHDKEPDGREIHIPTYCSCEAFKYHHHRPCWHLIAALYFAIDIIPVDTRTKRRVIKEFQRTNDVFAALSLLRKNDETKRTYNLDRRTEKRYEPANQHARESKIPRAPLPEPNPMRERKEALH